MLEKVKKESIPDKVFELLKREIINGTYKLGDKLPPEKELCQIFGVSRVSIKSALQKLCIIGIAEARVGDGTYVTNLDPQMFISQVQDFILLDVSNDDVEHFRITFDVNSLFVAMNRITEEELEELEDIVRQMREVAVEDEVSYNHLDYTFHYKLCLSSKNSIHKRIFLEWGQIIYVNIKKNNSVHQEIEKNRAWTHDLHCRMIEALRTKNAGLCLEIYNDLYNLYLVSSKQASDQ